MTDNEKHQLLNQIMTLTVRINAETSFRAEIQYGNEFDELHLKVDENIGFYDSLKIQFTDKINPLPYQMQTEAYAETFNRNLHHHLKNAVSVLTKIVETKKMNSDDFAYIDADELNNGLYGYYVF